MARNLMIVSFVSTFHTPQMRVPKRACCHTNSRSLRLKTQLEIASPDFINNQYVGFVQNVLSLHTRSARTGLKNTPNSASARRQKTGCWMWNWGALKSVQYSDVWVVSLWVLLRAATDYRQNRCLSFYCVEHEKLLCHTQYNLWIQINRRCQEKSLCLRSFSV